MSLPPRRSRFSLCLERSSAALRPTSCVGLFLIARSASRLLGHDGRDRGVVCVCATGEQPTATMDELGTPEGHSRVILTSTTTGPGVANAVLSRRPASLIQRFHSP